MYLKLCLTSLDGQIYSWQRLLDVWSGVTMTGLLCKLYNFSSVLLIVMLVSVFDRWPLRLIVSYPALFLSFLPFCQMLVVIAQISAVGMHVLSRICSFFCSLHTGYYFNCSISPSLQLELSPTKTMSLVDKISRNDRLMCHDFLLAISVLLNIWRNFCDLFSGSQLVQL
jgi:hypothetical protein